MNNNSIWFILWCPEGFWTTSPYGISNQKKHEKTCLPQSCLPLHLGFSQAPSTNCRRDGLNGIARKTRWNGRAEMKNQKFAFRIIFLLPSLDSSIPTSDWCYLSLTWQGEEHWGTLSPNDVRSTSFKLQGHVLDFNFWNHKS